jgi:hypothetical protein
MYMSVNSPTVCIYYIIYIYDVLYVCICPSIDACWYGRVNLIFKIRVRTDTGPVIGQEFSKSVVYVVLVSHILGRLPLIPAGDFGTMIPRNMSSRGDACYPLGSCNKRGAPGSGSKLFYINSIWEFAPEDILGYVGI